MKIIENKYQSKKEMMPSIHMFSVVVAVIEFILLLNSHWLDCILFSCRNGFKNQGRNCRQIPQIQLWWKKLYRTHFGKVVIMISMKFVLHGLYICFVKRIIIYW